MRDEELQAVYKGTGICIWIIQQLEYVLHVSITIKIDGDELKLLPEGSADDYLSRRRRLTLGQSLSLIIKNKLLDDHLIVRLKEFKEKRDWLVHRCYVHNGGENLFTPEGRLSLFETIPEIMEEAEQLKISIAEDLFSYSSKNSLLSREMQDKVDARIDELRMFLNNA